MLALFDMDEDSLESDSITVAGYILEHAGIIPLKRESIEAGGFRFTVMEVKDQRILRVVAKRINTVIQNEKNDNSENENN